ncbi:hypothetical protein K469DRAFT_683659 [Zopfia rhizophila CBS 207.26]|uniref:Uncharacterized protein n=1 Tax=Zopfia rhizophila CBS 207.26 TaxID=1314779 RepID=A0A6A6EDV3_9PEZI|nr:hypothetical protein K469DRAFT_683659 [Zopfia rhizophila CBS 207.26]
MKLLSLLTAVLSLSRLLSSSPRRLSLRVLTKSLRSLVVTGHARISTPAALSVPTADSTAPGGHQTIAFCDEDSGTVEGAVDLVTDANTDCVACNWFYGDCVVHFPPERSGVSAPARFTPASKVHLNTGRAARAASLVQREM